jgi:Protein of unknown function (DUF1460)
MPDNRESSISRRDLLKSVAASAMVVALPSAFTACRAPRTEERVTRAASNADEARLREWSATLTQEGLTNRVQPLGPASTRVGELAIGTPYKAYTLEEYIKAGGDPTAREPLTLSLTEFDCVSLVEACLGVARAADNGGTPSWGEFASEVERVRYRGGRRGSYSSRLHYFSEWISDGANRGLLRNLGQELGGIQDKRPLRFMTEHRASYPALANDTVFREIGEMERSLDASPRWLIPTARIAEVSDRIQTGDVLAFATSIPGLDVTHSAFAYRDKSGILRVLHAPLSGGVVEISRLLLPDYVAAIKRSTGILVARPLRT